MTKIEKQAREKDRPTPNFNWCPSNLHKKFEKYASCWQCKQELIASRSVYGVDKEIED